MEFQRVQHFLLRRPEVAKWPVLEAYLARKGRVDGEPLWGFVDVACRSCGGAPEDSLRGAAAIVCSLSAIHLVEDLLDEAPSPLTEVLGAGGAANLALGLQGLAHLCLDDGPPVLTARLQAVLAEASLATAHGQDLDRHPIRDEAGYWRVAEAKTPPLCRAALELGALLAGSPEDFARRVGELGWPLGLFLQLGDDLDDAFARPARDAWRRPRHNYALATALDLEPGFARLAERAADDPEALTEAQRTLIRGGTLAHGVEKMLALLAELCATGRALGFPEPAPFEELIEGQLRPLAELFAQANLDPRNLPIGGVLFATA